MNKLPTEKRDMILNLLVEGSSMRAISRITGVSINTVTKLLVDAGEACAAYHDEHVRNVSAKNIQCDEIWSFTYAKDKNVAAAKAAPEGAGDTWTWTALDSDTKLIISYLVGGRDAEYANEFMHDVADRLTNRVQLTTNGHSAYLEAVEDAFGSNIDYAMLIKLYSGNTCTSSKAVTITGNPEKKGINTSYVERQNLTMRMHMRRFTRKTNGPSKKVQNHFYMLSIYFVYYNFCKIHKTLKVTPAMEAGLSDTLRDISWIGELIDARAPKPKERGAYKKAA
uniref:DDE domain-containing protein n=1 Tax=Candidatus Kentrum sp. FM TaxID=2126340 RepID=A0A450W645_9GAMM|nr:MAG: DDE domain-containing protein [Candidatus Kentron sp. FM]VFJ60311.1 MAG: DDE domain-containing protein [Candidatus Kentron sp. FM]VFK12527.1 MAG: DDE domain-containing protein [Candidatus Kentron sp. FM]